MNSFKTEQQLSRADVQGVYTDMPWISAQSASEEAWRTFEQSGEVFDYMKYCNLRSNKQFLSK